MNGNNQDETANLPRGNPHVQVYEEKKKSWASKHKALIIIIIIVILIIIWWWWSKSRKNKCSLNTTKNDLLISKCNN